MAGCFIFGAADLIFSEAAVPAIFPNTRPSSSELLPRRFAPCRPVEAASPQQ